MPKTIQVSDDVHAALFARKLHPKDSVNTVVRSLLDMEAKKEGVQ